MDIAPANQRNPPPEADCKIKLDVSASDSKVVRTDIKHADDTFAGTKVKSLKNGRLRGTTRVQCKGIPEDSNVNVVRSNLISNTRVMAQRNALATKPHFVYPCIISAWRHAIENNL